MSTRLSREETCLLALLKSALCVTPVPAVEDSAINRVIALARAHAVLPLLYPVLEGLVPREQYAKAAEICSRQYYHLLFLTRYYVEALSERGIRTVVLKGAGAALAYPVPEYRKSGDVDLLLLDLDRLDDALQVIHATGAVEEPEQHANHHRSFRTPDGIVLELHVTISEDFDNRSTNEYLLSLQETMKSHVIETELLPGVTLPLPEAPYQAFFLLIHMLQHFLRSGFGLRLLCDWVSFWNSGQAEADGYLTLIRASGLEGFSNLISAACVRFLGMNPSVIPAQAEESLCEELLLEVFAAEEYGNRAPERMVMVRGGIFGYFREFHHQTCLNYPRACKNAVLWPALWLITLVRFLWNNRTLRKTSLMAVLRETQRRSRLMEPLNLFKKNKK